MQREKRDPFRVRERDIAERIQPIDVLASNAQVTADVNDINSSHLATQMLDGFCKDASCDERLSQTDFIRNEEPVCGVRRRVKPMERMLHRISLEAMQAIQDVV